MLDIPLEDCHYLGRPSAAAGKVLADVAARNGWHKPQLATSWAGIPSLEVAPIEGGASAKLGADYVDAPLDHPGIELGRLFLQTWPEQLEEAALLWSRIHPITTAELEFDRTTHGYGCTCGGVAGKPFEIYSTVYDPLGFAEGIVHEFAHWKLYTLGVHLESWPLEFLENDFAERYESPIRKDIERPMAAVVHAHYSYLHVIEINLRRVELGLPGGEYQDAYMDGLQTNLGRMIEGHNTLAEHVQPGPYGRAFFENIGQWGLEVIDRAEKILD